MRARSRNDQRTSTGNGASWLLHGAIFTALSPKGNRLLSQRSLRWLKPQLPSTVGTAALLTSPKHVSNRLVILLASLVVAAAVGSVMRAGIGDDPADPPVAVLAVDGVTYRLAPTACAATTTDFLVAGTGSIDEGHVWLSVSPARAELATGRSEAEARAHEGSLWLSSIGEVRWTRSNQSIQATLTLIDQTNPDADPLPADLIVDCGAV